MVSSFTFCFCVLLQTAFLHVFVKNDILQLGAYDHSVLYATAQLTEGRSARDQPKQPPAKKKQAKDGNPWHLHGRYRR